MRRTLDAIRHPPKGASISSVCDLKSVKRVLCLGAVSSGCPRKPACRGGAISEQLRKQAQALPIVPKNKTEPREGICEHLQSTAPHNATGNEAFIIEAVPPFVCGVH